MSVVHHTNYPHVRTHTVSEAGGWSVFISGLPVAADGATFDEVDQSSA